MKQLLAAFKRSPKGSAALLTIAAAVIVPATLFSWGPASRPTYTIEKPAPHVTFNSITNNPRHGNELNFVQIREAGTSKYVEEVNLTPGKEYEVRVYYHNNAASNLNGEDYTGKGVAQDAAMRVQMPASVKAGEKARFTGIVSASNAQPKEVWDEAYGKSDSAVALRYVQGSAKIGNFGKTNGATLPDSLVSTGVKLGFDKLDGKVPGCNEYAGYVTYRFKVDQPNFSVEKQVSAHGKNSFGETTNAKAGDKVDFRVVYKNTGTTQQNNVVVKDQLPQGLSYVAGTTQLASSASNGKYAKVSDNLTTASGINIGSYAPNGNAYVKFTAQVSDASKLECGLNKLTNKAIVETANGGRTDTAEVVVEKKCDTKPEPKKIEVCELDTKKVITINESDFDASKHSKDLADCEAAPVTPEKPEQPTQPERPTEVPAELPKTGLAESALSLLGLGSLVASGAYYLKSRRA